MDRPGRFLGRGSEAEYRGGDTGLDVEEISLLALVWR